MVHIIKSSRASIGRRGNYLKVFSPFPVLHSYYVPSGQDLVTPIQSDFSMLAVKGIEAHSSFVLLRGIGARSELVTKGSEVRKMSIRRDQYLAFNSETKGDQLSLDLVRRNLSSKLSVTKWMSTDQPRIETYVHALTSVIPELEQGERWRTFLFSDEADFSQLYFSAFDEFCAAYNWEFVKRSRRPAENDVNALLNYGYAVLKGTIDDVVIASGLDPYVGFLHTLRPGRESLSLDIIEPFRATVVDQSILDIIRDGGLDSGDFEHRRDEVKLSDVAKSTLVKRLHEKLFLGTSPLISEVVSYVEYILGEIRDNTG